MLFILLFIAGLPLRLHGLIVARQSPAEMEPIERMPGWSGDGAQSSADGAHAEPSLCRGSNSSAAEARIPKIVIMTARSYPREMVDHNLMFLPDGTEFCFYNDQQLLESAKAISDHLSKFGVHGAYKALKQLRPWAYRADLWRYMILWERGGVYLDSKIMLGDSISKWFDMDTDSFAVCRDTWKASGLKSYYNGALASRPREPILLETIRRVIANVESHYYGPYGEFHGDLYISGPGVLAEVIRDRNFMPRVPCRLFLPENLPRGIAVPSVASDAYLVKLDREETLLMYVDHKSHQATHDVSSAYSKLFARHLVYCDEALPDGEHIPSLPC